MAQLTPQTLTVSCFSKIQIGFTFLVPDYPGSPGKRAIKRVCVQRDGHLSLEVVARQRFLLLLDEALILAVLLDRLLTQLVELDLYKQRYTSYQTI